MSSKSVVRRSAACSRAAIPRPIAATAAVQASTSPKEARRPRQTPAARARRRSGLPIQPSATAASPSAKSSVRPDATEPRKDGARASASPPTSGSPDCDRARIAPPRNAATMPTKTVRFHATTGPERAPTVAANSVVMGSMTAHFRSSSSQCSGPSGQRGRASACHHCTQACPQISPPGAPTRGTTPLCRADGTMLESARPAVATAPTKTERTVVAAVSVSEIAASDPLAAGDAVTSNVDGVEVAGVQGCYGINRCINHRVALQVE